jgi:penicillin-binding protein 1B
VWRDLFARLGSSGSLQSDVEGIEYFRIDPASGLRAGQGCDNGVELPFIKGSEPVEEAPCEQNGLPVKKTVDWFKELFQ